MAICNAASTGSFGSGMPGLMSMNEYEQGVLGRILMPVAGQTRKRGKVRHNCC